LAAAQEEATEEVRRLESDMVSTKSEMARLESDAASAKSEIGRLQSDAESAKSEIERLQAAVEAAHDEMRRLRDAASSAAIAPTIATTSTDTSAPDASASASAETAAVTVVSQLRGELAAATAALARERGGAAEAEERLAQLRTEHLVHFPHTHIHADAYAVSILSVDLCAIDHILVFCGYWRAVRRISMSSYLSFSLSIIVSPIL
jgi:hypothetical protein